VARPPTLGAATRFMTSEPVPIDPVLIPGRSAASLSNYWDWAVTP